jgi:hypothetical protein
MTDSVVKKYSITVDLENITIEDALFIQDVASSNVKDKASSKVGFRRSIEILDQCCVVEGFETIKKLPLKAIYEIMDAFASEMEKMAASTPGPTLTSDLPL